MSATGPLKASAAERSKVRLSRILHYFLPHAPMLALSVILSFLVNAAALAKPFIMKQLIDDHLARGESGSAAVVLLALSYFVAVLLGAACSYAVSWIVTGIGQKIMHVIRMQLFTHVQGMSVRFFDRNSTGRILTRLTTDVEALNELFSTLLVNLVRDSVMIAGIVVMMFALDPTLALAGVSSVPAIAIATVIYRKAARKNFVKMKGTIARINGFLAENISGMRLVQIFHREEAKYEELAELDREYFGYSLREVILNSFSRPFIDIVNNLTIALLVLFFLGRRDSGAIQVGVLYAFISYVRQFFEPISAIAEQYTSIQSAVVSSERVFQILDTEEYRESAGVGLEAPRFRGEIEFRDVWFAYDGENWILKGLSFKIEGGQFAAFVGTTGSGKSTIISLLARFHDAQKGRILLDGRDLREYELKSLRRQISVVIQDVFLFSGDIASNISLNDGSIGEGRIREAARLVGADRFIEAFPLAYAEPVKERGCTFSAGQRQLISFARALAFDPSILILDEATANIDTDAETKIQEAMSAISDGRTSIIIAHRLSTVRNADRIFVVSKGTIAEFGTHKELMALKGVYWKWRRGLLGRQEETAY